MGLKIQLIDSCGRKSPILCFNGDEEEWSSLVFSLITEYKSHSTNNVLHTNVSTPFSRLDVNNIFVNLVAGVATHYVQTWIEDTKFVHSAITVHNNEDFKESDSITQFLI